MRCVWGIYWYSTHLTPTRKYLSIMHPAANSQSLKMLLGLTITEVSGVKKMRATGSFLLFSQWQMNCNFYHSDVITIYYNIIGIVKGTIGMVLIRNWTREHTVKWFFLNYPENMVICSFISQPNRIYRENPRLSGFPSYEGGKITLRP